MVLLLKSFLEMIMFIERFLLASKLSSFVFLSLETEGDSNIVIDCFSQRASVPCSIRILMEDVWKLN